MSNENSPLLAPKAEKPQNSSAVPRILFCAFAISLSIAFTWVPMIYVFRLMTCTAYYENHPPFTGLGDQCSISEIEASTARSVSLLGTTTTIFGVLNLFFAGWTIKRFGVKFALIQQTIWPSLRLCSQIIAVTIGSNSGMAMIQIGQFICALGGPAGYLLALNTYASEVVEPSKRTAVFGQLQGAVMFGTAVGYMLGGLTGDLFGIRRPFEIAFFLMLFSMTYSIFFLPYIPPHEVDLATLPKGRNLSNLFGPLRVFVPRKLVLKDGKVVRHWGVFLLGIGVFWGVLATGFIPVLIQMYATNAFGFRPTENGYLMSFNSLIRGCFLSLAFPRIISVGRKWLSSSPLATITKQPQSEIPIQAENFEPIPGLESEIEPTKPPTSIPQIEGSAFDLLFLRWSMVADGFFTGSAAFSRQGWHIYLAAFMLPLASGSAPAAKGVMMEMCDPADRADALSAITLVEMIATLSTMSVFGLVFSWLAEIGRPNLVFICNAGVAVIAVVLLSCSRFPPKDSIRLTGAGDMDARDENV